MFRTLLQMTQNQLFDFAVSKLEKYNYKPIIGKTRITEEKEYIAAPGDIPIVLVAHLDTVFDDDGRKDMVVCHDTEQGIWWSPNGLGADDRAGVYMIFSILEQTKLRPHILFTTDEETIGGGADAVAKIKDQLFKNVSYIIELDRKGYQESVYYDCDNPEFEAYVNSFGFHTDEGTFTDISIICPNWGVAGVNLSVGYLWEHSYIEHFYSAFWYDTYRKVVRMLDDKEGYKDWKYIPKKYEIKEKQNNGKGRRQ